MAEARIATVEEFRETFRRAREELARVVVGQERAVEHLLGAVFAGGHVLLKGAPGLGRTLLVKTLAHVLGLEYRRIQFTPDLLPTDIVGAEVLEGRLATGDRRFRFFKGPVFFRSLFGLKHIDQSPAVQLTGCEQRQLFNEPDLSQFLVRGNLPIDEFH